MDTDYRYDILKMYFCEDYEVCKGLVIHQPTIGEILEYGESKFWTMASTLCTNPTMLRLSLWDIGIDWNDLSDFELFIMLSPSFNKEDTSILLGDIDFTKFETIKNDKDEYVMVYMPDPTLQINEEIYNRFVGYMRIMFNIDPKVEKAKGKSTKDMIIWEERQNLELSLKKQKENKWKKSVLFPLISAAVNHPGFKYKKNELKEVGIVEFMDSIKRLQIYENVTSLMTGMYMGMIDTKGMDLGRELNWTRDLYEE